MANKYGAKRTTVDGITFASIAESRRYELLKMLERAGQITNLVLQPEFEVHRAYKHPVTGKRIRAIKYRADFAYYDVLEDKHIIEDVKGFENAIFKMKRKIVEDEYEILITIVK